MTLVEFLEARLAEDELMAAAAVEGSADWHVLYSYRDVKDGEGRYVVLADSRYPTVGQAAHIARHSPDRILLQCEAVRAVIAEFLRLEVLGDLPARDAVGVALKAFASVYGDHPDLDPTWR